MAFVHKSYCKKKFEGNENLLEKKPLDVIQKKERLKKINTTLEAIQLGMVR
jgi:hypothetical protein